MPYALHPSFTPPAEPTVKVWRFMSLAKFLDLLERHDLYFPKVTTLDDPLEGSLSDATVEALRRYPEQFEEPEKSRLRGVIEHNLGVMRQARDLVHVSSWHINEHESAAMWRLYSPGEEGLGIQSTFKRLTQSFHPAPMDVYAGVVRYLDYAREEMPKFNVFDPALHKRRSFEHERELRAAVLTAAPQPGVYVPVDLSILIERVYLSPEAGAWFVELLRRLLKRYGVDNPVSQSSLIGGPLY